MRRVLHESYAIDKSYSYAIETSFGWTFIHLNPYELEYIRVKLGLIFAPNPH